MSGLDPADPFDNGQHWYDVPSNPRRNNYNSHAGAENSLSTSTPAAERRDHANLNIPTSAVTAAPTAPSTAPAEPTVPASLAAPSVPTAVLSSQLPKQKSPQAAIYDDEPPSYEAAVIRDIPQIHDNYDHLRGPPGQRGVDIKTRIPLDSTPASYYQSSSAAGTAAVVAAAMPSAPVLLQGQVSEGRADDEAHARDVDRLLGPSHDHHHHQHQEQRRYPHHDRENSDADDEPESHWGIVGKGKAWIALIFLLIVLLPWAVFCFVWTFSTLIIAAVSMIIPPLGYLIVIPVITSWRALARVDLVVSRALVARNVREKHPYSTSPVFVMPAEPFSEWNAVQGYHQTRRRTRRQARNMWDRGAKHLKATVNNKHTVKGMFYLMIWKMFYALPVFIVVVVFAVLTIPFMICLLPTLLILSRVLISWQFRWAVLWLTEKPQPISLP
ncbi:hypothetical protein BGX28_009031 [Mortierella sp. GBA30]|nr:hypothetical protein BGX28_009031 [Mortierella sp. GBA30]